MLWLVRHGESAANAGQVTSEYAAIPLTVRGRVQAEAVAAACPEGPAWVGCSPYLRARQTAAPLLARYPNTPVTHLAVQEFTFLAARGRTAMDPVTRQPLVNAYWSRMDPKYCDGDGAESFVEFWDRARAFLVDAAGRSGFGLVFTHEQFIRAVLMAARNPGAEPSAGLMREFLEMRRELPIANGEVVRLRWKGGRWWVGGFSTFRLQGSSRARLASRGQLRRCSRSGDSTV